MIAGALPEPARVVFRAAATTVVPESVDFSAAEWKEFDAVVDSEFATRPEPLRKQLLFFIRALEAMPVARYAARFSRLDAGRRQAVLARIQDSRVDALRRGFGDLRTLILMGYYARPAAAAAIGYRATPAGWSARRSVAAPRQQDR